MTCSHWVIGKIFHIILVLYATCQFWNGLVILSVRTLNNLQPIYSSYNSPVSNAVYFFIKSVYSMWNAIYQRTIRLQYKLAYNRFHVQRDIKLTYATEPMQIYYMNVINISTINQTRKSERCRKLKDIMMHTFKSQG